jgi:hypothetical protein
MKNYLILSILSGSLLVFSCSDKKSGETKTGDTIQTDTVSDASVVKKYPVKSGTVTFETLIEVGDTKINEKKMLYFDEYGMIEAEETYEGGSLTSTMLSDGKDIYNLVHADKSAYRSAQASAGVAYKFDWNALSQSDKDSGKFKKLPNETVAGKDCEAYVMEDNGTKTKFAGWNNITLLIEQESAGMKSTTKAIKVEEGTVPAGKLSLPADYTVKEK